MVSWGRTISGIAIALALAANLSAARAAPASPPPQFDESLAASGAAIGRRDFQQAEASARAALALAVARDGEEGYYPDRARFQLALALNAAGRRDEAGDLFARSVAWRTQHDGRIHGHTAEAAYWLAAIRMAQSRPDEARAAIEQAIAGFESGRADRYYRDWLNSAYSVSLVLAGNARDVARQTSDYEKMLALSEEDNRDPALRAEYRYRIGTARMQEGKHEEAITILRQAGDERLKALGADDIYYLYSQYFVGWMLVYHTSRESEAIGPLRIAVEGFRKAGAGSDNMLGASLGALADGLNYTSRNAEAVPVRRELLARAIAKDPAGAAAMTATDELATSLLQAGKAAEAEKLYAATLDRADVKAAPAENSASLRVNYGVLLSTRGGIAAGVEQLRLAVTALALKPERKADYQNARALLSTLLIQQGNATEADLIVQKLLPELRADPAADRDVLAIVETAANSLDAMFGRDGQSKASATSEPFLLALEALGREDYVGAIEPLRLVMADLDARLPLAGASPELQSVRTFLGALLGLCLGEEGQTAEAEKILREIATGLETSTLPSLLYYRAFASEVLGGLLVDSGRQQEAIPLLTRAADVFAKSSLANDGLKILSLRALAEALKQSDPADRKPLALFEQAAVLARANARRVALGLDAGADPGEQALARATSGGRISKSPLRDAYADYLSEAARREASPAPADRSTILMMMQDLASTNAGQAMRATAARMAQGTGPTATLAQEQAGLAEQARQLDAALSDARQSTDLAKVAELETQRSMLAAQLASVDERIARDNPGYALLLAPKAIDLKTLRKRLRPGEALLLFAGGGELSQFVLAVSQDAFAWQVVSRQDLVDGSLTALRCSLDSTNCAPGIVGGASAPFAQGPALSLYEQLIVPVAGPLTGNRTVYVAASGRMGELPLAVLPTSGPAADGSQHWFGDDHDFVLLPSVASLRAPGLNRQAATNSTPYVGYGAPRLDPPDGPPKPHGEGVVDPQWLRGMYRPLPAARGELRAVSREMGVPLGMVRSGEEATERQFRADPSVPTAAVIHLATHGYLPDPQTKLTLGEPGIVFTPPAEPRRDDDGMLTASEVAMLKLSADWLLLSACSTATAGGGEGTIADADALGLLARAFFYAGVRRMVASHWRLSDETAPTLLTTMLDAMKRDASVTPAAALSMAERAVRTGRFTDGSLVPGWRPAWRHPFYWGSLSLIAASNDR